MEELSGFILEINSPSMLMSAGQLASNVQSAVQTVSLSKGPPEVDIAARMKQYYMNNNHISPEFYLRFSSSERVFEVSTNLAGR